MDGSWTHIASSLRTHSFISSPKVAASPHPGWSTALLSSRAQCLYLLPKGGSTLTFVDRIYAPLLLSEKSNAGRKTSKTYVVTTTNTSTSQCCYLSRKTKPKITSRSIWRAPNSFSQPDIYWLSGLVSYYPMLIQTIPNKRFNIIRSGLNKHHHYGAYSGPLLEPKLPHGYLEKTPSGSSCPSCWRKVARA